MWDIIGSGYAEKFIRTKDQWSKVLRQFPSIGQWTSPSKYYEMSFNLEQKGVGLRGIQKLSI